MGAGPLSGGTSIALALVPGRPATLVFEQTVVVIVTSSPPGSTSNASAPARSDSAGANATLP